MKASEGKIGRVFVIRLEDGDMLPACIERFAEEKGISLGHVILIGGIGGGEVVVGPRYTDTMPPDPMLRTLAAAGFSGVWLDRFGLDDGDEDGDQDGVVETVSLNPAGGRLMANANAAGGELRVAVLDESGRPLPGYERGDCVPLATDAVRHAVCWKEHDRLPESRPLCFRFHLKRASLFSFAVR